MPQLSKRQGKPAAEAAPERAARVRQRQRLIDACISALHMHGPSRTTVEKVVALADLSPGIVRFYFDSKDAMLVASLAYLAAEFEERVLVPVAQLKDDPVRALERLVELYLDPDIASPRKVSVWYCFWGEATSRQEYQEICGRKDEDFSVLVRDLIERLIARTGATHLDADGIALGLIGVLEVLWQTIAFQEEPDLDREAARRRSLGYLRSVFPGHFGAAPASAPPAASVRGALPASAYADAALLTREREQLLRPAWQLVGHRAELPAAGDFIAADLAGERALVLRDAHGSLRAFRNACPQRPHTLLPARTGQLAGPIECAPHALSFSWEGRLLGGECQADLTPLEVAESGALIFVRGAGLRVAPAPPALDQLPASWVPVMLRELTVAADWKLLVEQWLDADGASAAGRRRGGAAVQRRVLPPNQLLELNARAAQILQLIPDAPGRCRIRAFGYAPAPRKGRGVGQRWPGAWLAEQVSRAESTQQGLTLAPAERAPSAFSLALADFQRAIAGLMPAGAGRSAREE
jgi:TetR/AcrR family transcriptional regulator, transcriptional repressor of bet genes